MQKGIFRLATLSVATFIVRAVISLAHIRFRQGLAAQGQDAAKPPYRAAFNPLGTYLSGFLTPFSATDFTINHILLPAFVLFVLVYKFWIQTKPVNLAGMDISTEYPDEEKEIQDRIVGGVKRQRWSLAANVVIG